MSRKNFYNLLIAGLLISLATITYADIGEKIEQINIDQATLDDVIKVFGEPEEYVWSGETFEKDNLPGRFVMAYPNDFSVFMANDQIVELRHGGPGTGYLWQGKLMVGDSLERVIKAIGEPVRTIEGQENRFVDATLYKDIEDREGHCYYAREDLDLRLWFGDYKIAAIYMTRSDYGDNGGSTLKDAEIPSTSIIDENGRIVDKIDYPFINDPEVLGAWKSVDFVREIEDFKSDRKSWAGELWLNHLIFEGDGIVRGDIYIWTKDLVINEDGKTASAYQIKEIDGEQYMFFEWKSGDYTIRHRKPSYYVLKKVPAESLQAEAMFGQTADIPSTSIIDENGRIVDKIDYPFVDDPEVIGTWTSVDFVENIEDFNQDTKDFEGELYLKQLVILENGETEGPWSWTKGLLLHPGSKTASKYLIKEIDGQIYMFFEWKSGDYTIRRRKPSYYVLIKEK